jgi:type II secretory pathway pseudopilin PulG
VHSPHHSTRAAFTIVELLVCLSIITMLLTLLLPSLSAARDTAQRIKCTANVHTFMFALNAYINDDKQNIPCHYLDNIDFDGNSFPALQYMTTGYAPAGINPGNYLDLKAMICPTTPTVYRYKYSGVTHPWDPNDTTFRPFYQQSSVYNVPCGTYQYHGGANLEDASPTLQSYRIWDTTMGGVTQFQMTTNNIIKPSQYSPYWDQDRRRNYALGYADADIKSSHYYIPGRSFGFLDGHVTFYADSSSEVANCTLTNWFKGTEHITPYTDGYVLYFATGPNSHGANANLAGTPNPMPNVLSQGIMHMPGG